jgi:hypothetical protein
MLVLAYTMIFILQMTDTCHHTQSLVQMGSYGLLLGWSRTMILLISASLVATIISMSHSSLHSCVLYIILK